MPSRFQEMLKNQRQYPETSRAGLKWDTEEENQLLSLVSNGQTLPEIAKTLQRTEGSIKTRLITYALSKMENDNLSISQVCEIVNLTEEDLTEYQQKKQHREDYIKQKKTLPRLSPRPLHQSSNRSANATIADVYDLLLNVNKSLQKISPSHS